MTTRCVAEYKKSEYEYWTVAFYFDNAETLKNLVNTYKARYGPEELTLLRVGSSADRRGYLWTKDGGFFCDSNQTLAEAVKIVMQN